MGNQNSSKFLRSKPSGDEPILGDGTYLAIKNPGPEGRAAKFTILRDTVVRASPIIHKIQGWPACTVYRYLHHNLGWEITRCRR